MGSRGEEESILRSKSINNCTVDSRASKSQIKKGKKRGTKEKEERGGTGGVILCSSKRKAHFAPISKEL